VTSMRSVLPLAFALLGLVLLIDVSSRLVGRRGDEQRTRTGSARAIEVVAASRGRLLPRATFGGVEPLADVIQCGDKHLWWRADESGIRVAELNAALELVAYTNHETARSPDDVRTFAALPETVDVGGVLILVADGDFRPAADPALARELDAAAARLGSEVAPCAAPSASWALLALRLPDGWVKLAECFSEDRGVVLAFTLSPDLERYRGYRGETFVDVSDERVIQLESELDQALQRGNAAYRIDLPVGGEFRGSILATVSERLGSSRVVWSLPLSAEPVFECLIGLRDGAWKESDGVVFQVLVDDELVAERPLGTPSVGGAPTEVRWLPWRVELGEHAGREVRFELTVTSGDPGSHAAGDWALWGEPWIRSR